MVDLSIAMLNYQRVPHLGRDDAGVLSLDRDGNGDKDPQVPDLMEKGPWNEDVLEMVGEGGHSCLGISGQ